MSDSVFPVPRTNTDPTDLRPDEQPIVGRLRYWAGLAPIATGAVHRPTLTAAADEIERLRVELAAVTERANELEARRTMHGPDIAPQRSGQFGVFCQACSSAAGDYVYPCREGKWDDVPSVLVAEAELAATYAKYNEQKTINRVTFQELVAERAQLAAVTTERDQLAARLTSLSVADTASKLAVATDQTYAQAHETLMRASGFVPVAAAMEGNQQ